MKKVLLIAFLSLIPTSVVVAQTGSTVFTVPSSPIWTYTGITLQSSDNLTIHDAMGSWTFATNSGFYGPEGLFAPHANSSLFITNGQIGQLIGFIGENPYGIAQNDLRLFAIGSGFVSLTGKAGKLWLGMNDDYTDQIGGASDNAGSLSVTVGITTQSEFTISFSTFIPGNYVSTPLTCSLNIPGTRQHLFVKTDDRWFDPIATTGRTRQKVTAIPDEFIDEDGFKEGTAQTVVTNTELYAKDALPVIDQDDNDGILNDCHLLHAIETPVVSGVHILVVRLGPQLVRVHLRGNAGTGTAGLGRICGISWDITLDIDTSESFPVVTYRGTHDGFPAYELYINNKELYTYNPGVPPYNLFHLSKLCGSMEVMIPTNVVIIN